jgi:hypothetical protein
MDRRLVGPKDNLDAVVQKKNHCIQWESNLERLTTEHVTLLSEPSRNEYIMAEHYLLLVI